MAALNAANGRANVASRFRPKPRRKPPSAARCRPHLLRRRAPSPISRPSSTARSRIPKKIEELKAEADARPTGKESREELAQFYFDRGNARAQLGRLADAIADANKAIEIGRGAVDPI